MRTRWMAVVLVVVGCGLGAGCVTAGAHSIPKLEGVVVDGETGEPVEGARLRIAYLVTEGGIHLVDTPGEYPCCGGEAETGPDGRFELPGYWGPEGTSGGSWSVFRKGYVPLRFKYGASRKSGKVWFSWSPLDEGWKRNLEWRWEGRHVFVRVKLEPVRGTDPEVWERYLKGLAEKAKGTGPEAWDFRHILLDEAYRYVSQGGELTEGIMKALEWNVLSLACRGGAPYRDERRRQVACWVVRNCEEKPAMEWCRSHPKTLACFAVRARCEEGSRNQ